MLPIGVGQSHLIHTPTTIPGTPHACSPSYLHHNRFTQTTRSSQHPRLRSRPTQPGAAPPSPPLLSARQPMATMNSSVLACSYALPGASDPSWKLASAPSAVPPTASSGPKLPGIRAQQARPAVSIKENKGSEGRRAALLGLAATLFAATAASSSPANAGVIEEYLEKSKANKELNDKKRLATSGANFARAYTVEFGTCKFPENFTGCQDLAKQKKVPFLSDDLEIECEGKDKYKCGSNVFWKW